MFSGDWLHYAAVRGWLIAAILCLFVSVALGQTEQPKGARKGDQSAPKHTQSVKSPSATPKQEQASTNQQSFCDEAKSGPENVLCQQWRMANAAEKQIGWLSKQYEATLYEISALVAAVLFTAWAAIAATMAARAADRAIVVASKTAKHQLRAYLAPDRLSLGKRRDDGPIRDFVVIMRNFGQTPANQVTLKTRTGLSFGDNADNRWGEVNERPVVDLPPRQISVVEMPISGIEENNATDRCDEIDRKRAKVHAHVVFSYTDIYRVTWIGEIYLSSWGATFSAGNIGIDRYITEQPKNREGV